MYNTCTVNLFFSYQPSYAVHIAQLRIVSDDVVFIKMVKCQWHTVHTEAQKNSLAKNGVKEYCLNQREEY